MSDYVTYKITDSAGRTYYVTTDLMDVDNMWYRGNSNLSLSVDGLQYTSRQSLVANSRLISNPATGGGQTTYTTLVNITPIGTTDGVNTSWYTYGVLILIVILAVFTIFKRGRRTKSWKSY